MERPRFFTLSSASAGFQAGAREEQLLILLMTDKAVDNFVDGTIEMGGAGGFALGEWGASVSGSGEIKGGLEQIILTTDKGAFAGSAWAEIQPKPAKTLNDDIYGPNADLKSILDVPGGKYAPATQIRELLTKMVLDAWNTRK